MATADGHPRNGGELHWLLALALVNLAIYLAISTLPRSPGINFIGSLQGGALIGQKAALGMLAALLPRRATLGLAVIGAFTLLSSSAMWLVNGLPFEESCLTFADQTVTTQAMVWGLRVFRGSCITSTPLTDRRRSGQFQIMDLLEWTLLIATTLGTFIADASGIELTSFLILFFFVHHAVWLLMAFPILWVSLAQRSPGFWTIAALIVWSLLVAMGGLYADAKLQHVRMLVAVFFWPLLVPTTMGVVLVTAINGWALRRLGYRWWRPLAR